MTVENIKMIRFIFGMILVLGGVGGMEFGPILPSMPWVIAGMIIMVSPIVDGSIKRQLKNY